MAHIGCFRDAGSRDLPTRVAHGKGITVYRCFSLCKGRKFRFSGVQHGTECWCGNHYGRYGRRDKRECRTQCSGDKTRYCGGAWRNDIFATGIEPRVSGVAFLGCFRDNSKRDLPVVYNANHKTTKPFCRKYCTAQKYKYFGLQAGYQCTCGNLYGAFGRVHASQCNTPCRGDRRRRCGAGWKNAIYTTGLKSKVARSESPASNKSHLFSMCYHLYECLTSSAISYRRAIHSDIGE